MRTIPLAFAALLAATSAGAAPADLVIWGGPIYTAVVAKPKVETVAPIALDTIANWVVAHTKDR